jgi:hypothetical protein
VTAQALGILRSWDHLQGNLIPLLALVVYVYATEVQNSNWNGIAAALALYAVHWLVEIANAVIQHLSGQRCGRCDHLVPDPDRWGSRSA